MNLILLSGGSGKRLWPLSNDIRSKQFIKFFKKDDGEYESMVQRIYRQILRVDEKAKVTIATSKTQVSAIHNQLGDGVGISVEPCRRDTFPAIALATAYLHYVQGVSLEESVVVCPVDPYVNEEYFQTLKKLSDQADKEEANLVLMGIQPTYPSEKYGYIIPEKTDEVCFVSNFREKPDRKTAENYIAQGALWNGGVFAYKLKYVLNKAHELIDFTDYRDLFSKYETLKKISFDYAVMEKSKNVEVVPGDFGWDDVGSFAAFDKYFPHDSRGNVREGPCTVVEADGNICVARSARISLLGVKNLVVVTTPDAVLVADKSRLTDMKKLFKR